MTNDEGEYAFTGLGGGTYTVREVTSPNEEVVQTSQPGGAFGAVLTTDSHIASGPPIGNVIISKLAPLNVAPVQFAKGVGGPVASYITGVYRNVLGHDPTQGQLSAAVRRLGSAGESKRTVFARSIWDSREHRAQQVNGYYELFLGRNAETRELRLGVRRLRSGGEAGFVASLLKSPTYQAAQPTNAWFVASAFTQALGQTPDSATTARLVARLDRGKLSRQSLAESLLRSDAAISAIVASDAAVILQGPANAATSNALGRRLRRGGSGIEDAAVTLLASKPYFAKASANAS